METIYLLRLNCDSFGNKKVLNLTCLKNNSFIEPSVRSGPHRDVSTTSIPTPIIQKPTQSAFIASSGNEVTIVMVHAITFFCKSHWTVTWPLVVKIPVCALTRCSVMIIWSSWSKNTVSRCPCQCSDVIGAASQFATDQDFCFRTLGILHCAYCRSGHFWIVSRRVTQFPSSLCNCCQGNICLRSIGTVTYVKVGIW